MAAWASVLGDGGARVSVEIFARAREGGPGGGEWAHGSSRSGVARGEGSGRVGGDQGIVAVLGWLGGIPPSSLEARGEEDDKVGGGPGPAGPSPRRQVRFF